MPKVIVVTKYLVQHAAFSMTDRRRHPGEWGLLHVLGMLGTGMQ